MDSNKRPREEDQTPNGAPDRKIAKGKPARPTEPESPTPNSSKDFLFPPLGTKPGKPMITRKTRKPDKQPGIPKTPAASFPIMEDDLFSPSANGGTKTPEPEPAPYEQWTDKQTNTQNPASSGSLPEIEALETQTPEEIALENRRLLAILTATDETTPAKPEETTVGNAHQSDTSTPPIVAVPPPTANKNKPPPPTATGLPAATPNETPAMAAPAKKTAAFSLEDEEEMESSSTLLASLAEQTALANTQNAFGAFAVTSTPFDDIRIPLEAPGSTPKTAHETIQWTKILHQDCTIGRQHESGNPLDFMPDHVVEECKKAAAGKEHTLGDAKAVLVNPGFKILVRVVHRNCPHDKMPAWIKHAIRSALDTAKLPLNGALSIIRMGKPTYDWHVVALTAEAYAHLSTVRALYDPRSRVLVLMRLWSMTPNAVQCLNYTGINTSNDIGEDELKAARNLFRDQFTPVLAPHQVSIQEMSAITNLRAPDGPPMTQITFSIGSNSPFTLAPKGLPRVYTGPDGRPRTIIPSWPRRCTTCLSESHKELLECPWRTHDFNGSVVSIYSPMNLSPGQSEIVRKRRREDDTGKPESILTDMRPTLRVAKKQKTTMAPALTPAEPTATAAAGIDTIMA